MTQIHNTDFCDCEMCRFAQNACQTVSGLFRVGEEEKIDSGPSSASGIDISVHPPDCGCDRNECCAICCRACRLNQPHDAIPAAPDFDHEWEAAPRGMTNYVERSIAEYFYLRGRRAGGVKSDDRGESRVSGDG